MLEMLTSFFHQLSVDIRRKCIKRYSFSKGISASVLGGVNDTIKLLALCYFFGPVKTAVFEIALLWNGPEMPSIQSNTQVDKNESYYRFSLKNLQMKAFMK